MSTSVNSSKKISPTSLGRKCVKGDPMPQLKVHHKKHQEAMDISIVGHVKWDACATLLIEVLMHYQWDLSAFELHRGAFYLLLLLATCGISQQSNGSPNNIGAQTRHIWYSCSNLKLVQTCCHELRHCTHSHLIHLPNLSRTLTR